MDKDELKTLKKEAEIFIMKQKARMTFYLMPKQSSDDTDEIEITCSKDERMRNCLMRSFLLKEGEISKTLKQTADILFLCKGI